MPHGTPDWHAWDTTQLLYKSIDPAEATVRLGAVPSVDRMGQVIAHDNFSDGLADWVSYLYTDTHRVTLMAARARSAGHCVRLWWNDEEEPGVGMHTLRDYPLVRRVGIECYFHPYMSQGGYQLAGHFYTGTRLCDFGIQWRWRGAADYVVEVYDHTPAYVEVMAANYTYGFRRTWRCLKVVVDLDTNHYARAWWGPFSIPVSHMRMRCVSPTVIEPFVQVNVSAWGLATQEGECLVDDFILSTYEA